MLRAEVLWALHQRKIKANHSRKNVRGEDASIYRGEALGLVGARGAGAVISKATLEDTDYTRLLARLATEAKPGFQFTTIQVRHIIIMLQPLMH